MVVAARDASVVRRHRGLRSGRLMHRDGSATARFVPANLRFVKNPFSGPRCVRKTHGMRFDFEKFYQAVNAKRAERAASWRQVAREIGVGKSTLARMAQNKRPDADGLAALSFWAAINPADFVFPDEQGAASLGHRNGDSAECSPRIGGALSA